MESGHGSAPEEGDQLTPELEEAIQKLATVSMRELVGDSSELCQAVQRHQAWLNRCAATIIPWALEQKLTPQQAHDIVMRDNGDGGLATRVRTDLRIEHLRRAEGQEFERLAAEIEALSERSVGRDAFFRALDEERERRGLPPSSSKAAREEVRAARWRRAGEIASAEFDAMNEEERTQHFMVHGMPKEAAQQISAAATRGDSPGAIHSEAPGPIGRFLLRAAGLAFFLPVLVIGYAIAALLTTIPIYVGIAVVGKTYTLIPDEAHELRTGAMILGLITAWYLFTWINKALATAE